MKTQDSIEQPPEPSSNPFKTPRRPNPSTTARTPSATKRSAAPSTSERSWKRPSLSSSRAQSTLTQIDFVTQPSQPDDDPLEYIDRPGNNGNNNTEPIVVEDKSDPRSDPKTSLPADSNFTGSIFEANDDHPRRRRKSARMEPPGRIPSVRKSQTPKPKTGGKAQKKSSHKQPAKRDKTLTQMDFVRRYITIDDDNDVNLGYIESAPATAFSQGEKALAQKNSNLQAISRVPGSPQLKRTRREPTIEPDLSTGEPLTSGGHSQTSDKCNVIGAESNIPATPTKLRRTEIPSSQSPESPGLAIITSSQFRSATRSPTKRTIVNFHKDREGVIKEESSISPQPKDGSHPQDNISPLKTPTAASPKVLIASSQRPSSLAQRLASCNASPEPGSQKPSSPNDNSQISRTQRERTVVYETDAESDQSDEGCGYQDPATPSRAQRFSPNINQTMNSSPGSKIDDSQDLPLPRTEGYNELDSDPPSEAPMSDASIYYQRVQPATQFPYEPIPSLNTQKLSELFPNDGGTQHPNASRRLESTGKVPGPFLQSQTESQEADQTEIVPESSPIREREDSPENSEAVFQRPHPPNSVVQVESSQPVERKSCGPGMLLSRSQLLTSSIMESVPMPNFCTSSQDSVGEPYSLPDR